MTIRRLRVGLEGRETVDEFVPISDPRRCHAGGLAEPVGRQVMDDLVRRVPLRDTTPIVPGLQMLPGIIPTLLLPVNEPRTIRPIRRAPRS